MIELLQRYFFGIAPASWLVCLTFALAASVRAESLVFIFSTQSHGVQAGEMAVVTLSVLNPGAGEVSWSAPKSIAAQLRGEGQVVSVSLKPAEDSPEEHRVISPRSFASRDFCFTVPRDLSGELVLEFTHPSETKLLLSVAAPAEDSQAKESRVSRWLRDADADGFEQFAPTRFFKEHISGYEPFYFIAGMESPNARFQISFKYQLMNRHSTLAQELPGFERIHIAYTQTSLWDLDAPSAPFFDSSYKPEVLYAWEKLVGGKPDDNIRFDLQFGVQHESNGRNESESRSLNIAYIRPTLVLGEERSLQLTLQPRAWFYVGDLNDNPDLAEYRGYADIRAILGWQRGLQLSTTGRIGNRWENGSLQIDLTYPMMRFFYRNFSLYLHAQYFTGYGESLLRYDERSSAFRLGFSMYR